MPTKHVFIQGKVQGVFYRASAKEKADDLKLTGWVKNTPDGEVEVMVTGNLSRLDEFINWCKRGPAQANVTGIRVEETDEKRFESFRIVRH